MMTATLKGGSVALVLHDAHRVFIELTPQHLP